MKRTLIIAAVVTILFNITAIFANSNTGMNEKTLHFTGGYAITNPCNGEFASGPIDIVIVVNTAETGNGTFVTVNHTSHATLIGNTGSEYKISRHAKGKFDALSNQYVIPWRGEFVGKGAAPNFTATGELRVSVNADQEPTGSQQVNVVTTCSQ
jgi:hypothetical protein